MDDHREDFPVTAPLNNRHQQHQDELFTLLDSRLYLDVPGINTHHPVATYLEGTPLVLTTDKDKTSAFVRFSVAHHLVLGRPSPSAHAELVDLSVFEGYRYGVSRQHAMLWRSADDVLLIEDLGSRNGTFIDGQRLQPLKRYMLNHDDRLQLGELFLRLRFESVRADTTSV